MTKKFVCTLAIAGLLVSSLSTLASMMKQELHAYQAEGACVMKLIPLGIERSAIATGNGKCWIKE